MLRRVAAGRLYRYSLFGPAPADLGQGLAQRWTGDAERGAAIAAGDIELAGEMVRNPEPRWFPAAAGPEWLAAWHGFAWLADLAAGGNATREAGRELLRSWLAENAAWHPVAWRSDVLATRLFAWIAYLDEIVGRDQEPGLRRAMLQSFAAQLRHLGRTAGWECAGAQRLRALKGLVAGGIVLGGPSSRLARGLHALEREVTAQILPDGGHRSRNPSLQLQVLQDLIDIRGVLRAAGMPTPAALQEAIERMAPVLRLFRHGDRRLALFNDSLEEDGILIDLVLTRSEAKGSAPLRAPSIGFDRLQANQSLVILDTGGPPPHGFDAQAHAGPAMSHPMTGSKSAPA